MIELYEEPCVTLDVVAAIGDLRPRQIESLRRIGEREKNRPAASVPHSFINDDDSDDDWEISSVEPANIPKKPAAPVVNKNKRGGKSTQPLTRNDMTSSSWAGGNSNRITEVKEKQANPIEIWLKEAIDYVDNVGVMSSFAEEMKQALLEQEKGLIFDGDADERDLIEEEELREVQQEFRGDDDKAFKNPFIQIGKAYQRQTEPALGERPERKIVNYQKIRVAPPPDSQKFNFFDDSDNEESFEEDNERHSLERWMKEDDVSMWPLPVRLKAHRMWIGKRNTQLEAKLNAMMKRYYQLSSEIRKNMAVYEAKICKENRVIGMTSTGAVSETHLISTPKIN